jgi:hypothetical protein
MPGAALCCRNALRRDGVRVVHVQSGKGNGQGWEGYFSASFGLAGPGPDCDVSCRGPLNAYS